ncbi:MAG: hypothetical protein ACKVWR_07240 [Acidimicrobiales bacterium]
MLTQFVHAVTSDDEAAAAAVRTEVRVTLGDEWLVDAAAVVANFEMMTRVADGTGARMRAEQIDAAAPLRQLLGVDAFPSARRKPCLAAGRGIRSPWGGFRARCER